MQTANLLLHQLRSGTSEEAEEDASQRARSTKPPSADGVRDQLTGAMTISALLAGFAVGLSTTVTADEIRDYARWELQTFLGRNSTLCTAYEPLGLVDRCAALTN